MTKHQIKILNGLKNGDYITKEFKGYVYQNRKLLRTTLNALISTNQLYLMTIELAVSGWAVYYIIHESSIPISPYTLYKSRRIINVRKLEVKFPG